MSRGRTFAALRHKDFRLFWLGLVLSNLGGWMQQTAGPLLVYRLSGSAFTLGLVGFVAAVPAAPISLLAGPLIDRLPRRPLLIATQLGLFLPPLGLAVLVWTGWVQVWHVVVAELLRGALLAVDQPAKQAAIVDMTGKEDVASAIALWSSANSVTRVVGPAAAGLLIAAAGEGLCFFLNGVSYLAVVAALLAISMPHVLVGAQDGLLRGARRPSLTASLVSGLKYLAAKGQRHLLAMASLALLAAVLVRPFQTLLPVFADDVLVVGATGFGFLMAAAGAGAVLGALGAASLRPRLQRSLVWLAGLTLPVVAAGFALSHSFVLSCMLLLAVGGWEAALETAVNALMLVEVEDEYRGRVISLYTAAAMGAPRIGGLQAGAVAARWGAPLALGLGCAVYMVYSVILLGLSYVAAHSRTAMQGALPRFARHITTALGRREHR